MKTEAVKGFRDYTGEEAGKRQRIKGILAETFKRYGFELAETPIIESEEFVKGQNANDEAVSDIYKLRDKGRRKLALRYEFTFQLKRIAKNKKLPYKRYQIGEVFRDEPTSSNRFRQFTQCDIDTIGSTIKDEAEILTLTKEIFDKLGIKIDILINNRKLLDEVLDDLKIRKNRKQILRELDKLDKQGLQKTQFALRRLGAGKLLEAVSQGEEYLVKFDSYRDIISLKEYCKLYGVNVLFSPTIVRGLSYYTGSVFEIKAKNMKETICAGGSYEINGKKATGISFGLDRISQLAQIKLQREKFLVVSLEQDEEAIKVVRILRKQGKNASIFYGKPTKALEFANSYDYGNVIFVGEKEVRAKRYKVKDMKSGKESVFKK